ncbi:MAG TPA: response regulator transcription factor [Candidatus Deferrimicrobium sp.]|nr:response regulator transcription factor [Candidatus Deferrimicrobium sp.]
MSQQKVLIVDDESQIRAVVRLYLEKEGFWVEEAANGQDALHLLAEQTFDLLILDLMMPQVDGWQVCRQVRQKSNLPIIMLTARGEEFDRVLGFELGTDDYLVKPFSTRELVARVKALLKRTNTKKENEDVIAFPGLNIDRDSRVVTLGNDEIALTPKEFELLYFLAKHPGRVFSREQLMETVWGYDFYGDLRTVDTHIKKIREKIKERNYISTVWGVGYKFEPGVK